MVAIRPRQTPALPVAQSMLVALLGAHAVRASGTLFDRLEGRGVWRGLRVRVELAWHQTRKRVAPYTTIDVEEDLDLTVFTGGSAWRYPSHEGAAAFAAPNLATMALAGAPRALLVRLASGPVSERLAASGLHRLTIGTDAKRIGCATRGVRLELEGWPMDEVSLRYLLDTVAEITAECRRELASAGVLARGGRHPEVVVYERARAASRARGLQVAAAIGAGLSAFFLIGACLLVCLRG